MSVAKEEFTVSLVYIKHELFEYNKNLVQTLEENDKRLINQKLDVSFFEESMNNLTTAINDQIAKQERHFANKVQTKRAIEFLETKLNRFITEEYNIFKSKRHFGGNEDQYLKINKC